MSDSLATFRRASLTAAILSGALAAFTLLGWDLGSAWIVTLGSTSPAIHPVCALILLLLAFAFLLRRCSSRAAAVLIADAIGALCFAFAAASLVTHILDRDFWLDTLLFRHQLPVLLREESHRTYPLIAVILLLLASALLQLRFPRIPPRLWQGTALLALTLSGTQLMGFTFGLPALFTIGGNIVSNLPAALGAALLALGVLFGRPEEGWTAAFLSPRSGGVMLRRTALVAVLAPWIIGWFTLRGGRILQYPREADQIAMALAMMVLLLWMAWRNARSLDAADAVREAKAQELEELNRDLERRVADRTREIAAEREKFNLILDAVPPYVLLLTPDYHVSFANREFRKRFGEPGGRHCYEFLFGRTGPCENCETYKVLETDAPHDWEWTGPDARDYEVHDFPFTDSDGSRLILEVGIDVTERKRAERQLMDGQFYVRSLIESSLDAMMTTDAAGAITDVNQQMERLTGRPRAELIGSAFRQFCTEPQLAREGIELVLREGKVIDYELTVRAADGRETPVSYNANTFHDAAGKLCGVFATARDITERKQAERALRLSENRYRSLVTATSQVVWVTGPDGMVDDMPMWRDLTGQSLEEVRGWGWLQAVHPDDRARTAEVWRAALGSRSLYDIEYRIRRHDGTYRDLAARGVPVLEADGSVREWVGTCTDITQRKRAEDEIRELNAELEHRVQQRTAELEQTNKELEAFTYSVSHDLRAPLRHLDGFSRLLLEDYGPSLEPGAVEHLNRIRHAAVRLGQLIDDLLQFSRLGRHALHPQITGLQAVVREAIAELAPECEGREIEWRIGELPFVECDAALVKQIFLNLLSNSVKFTRPRARAIIEIGHGRFDGESALFVADNGVGFSMNYADKLFGVFQRLHRSEDFEGTGVGLATVKRIVQKHGGRIWAEAELDRGAKFYFTLSPPTVAETAGAAELAASGRD